MELNLVQGDRKVFTNWLGFKKGASEAISRTMKLGFIQVGVCEGKGGQNFEHWFN